MTGVTPTGYRYRSVGLVPKTAELQYLGIPKVARDWILRGILKDGPPPEERLRTKPGFIRVSDGDGYRIEAVVIERSITIKGKGTV